MNRAADMLGRLGALRAELIDLAYLLERRGRRDAADVALAVSARVGEIHDELAVQPCRNGVRPLLVTADCNK